MTTRIALPARVPIGRVNVNGQTLNVYASEDWIRALRVIVNSVNDVEAGIAASEVSFAPAGSVAAVTVQLAIEELGTEKEAAGTAAAAVAAHVALADPHTQYATDAAMAAADAAVEAFAIQRGNHTGTQLAATISNFSAAADARVAAAVGVSVQAYDADLTTWGGKTAPSGTVVGTTDAQALTNKDIDASPIGVGTPAVGSFTSLIASNYVKTIATTVAGLPSAGLLGAGTGGRSFVTDATSTTFASVVAGGGANRVPVYSDGTDWRIG